MSIGHEGDKFYCQAVSLLDATKPIYAFDLRHFILEINSSEEYMGLAFFRRLAEIIKVKILELLGFSNSYLYSKKEGKRVRQRLNLQPGEVVEVKQPWEILETLDSSGSTGGLSFMPEMMECCGGRYRVLKRVDKIIYEADGRMIMLKDTVVLDGAECDGKAHKGCQRNCYFIWKEDWLRRIEEK